MTAPVEPAGPREWTPGAGWERVNREIPQYVPELTEADERWADDFLARAGQVGADQDRAA
jgi:hypothetical protein